MLFYLVLRDKEYFIEVSKWFVGIHWDYFPSVMSIFVYLALFHWLWNSYVLVQCAQIFMHASDSLLSIQKMTGGGSPIGGRHCRTNETPVCTTMASFLSFDHKGDPVS